MYELMVVLFSQLGLFFSCRTVIMITTVLNLQMGHWEHSDTMEKTKDQREKEMTGLLSRWENNSANTVPPAPESSPYISQVGQLVSLKIFKTLKNWQHCMLVCILH